MEKWYKKEGEKIKLNIDSDHIYLYPFDNFENCVVLPLRLPFNIKQFCVLLLNGKL